MRFLGDASSALIALALALMVWLAATQAAEPMRERTVEAPLNSGVPIVLVGVPVGMATYGLSATTARVTVRGIAEDLAALSSDGVVVRADLSNLTSPTGLITATLVATCPRCPGRAARIVDVSPKQLVLHLETADRRQVAVEPAMEAPGVQACRGVEASFEPATVTVEGAASRVALVRSVIAEVRDGAGALNTSDAGAVAVTPITADGDPVADVAVSPESVSAAITLVPLATCADVAVLPVYSDPPPGYYVADIDVSPDHIQIHGDPDRLAAYRDDAVVLTELIDISESREPVQRLVVLDLPNDLETVGAMGGVTVTIRVSPVPGTRSIEVALEAADVPAGFTLEDLSPTRVAVLLSGPLPLLEALDDKTIRGVVSLAGLGAGTHRLAPHLDLPAGIRARSIAPAEVEARLVRGAGVGG